MSDSHHEFRLANDLDTELCQLENLSDSQDEMIRAGVALNQSATASMPIELFLDDSEYVQECLGETK